VADIQQEQPERIKPQADHPWFKERTIKLFGKTVKL
jgi:hypothetical protein